jgi:hypothetical protein
VISRLRTGILKNFFKAWFKNKYSNDRIADNGTVFLPIICETRFAMKILLWKFSLNLYFIVVQKLPTKKINKKPYAKIARKQYGLINFKQ